MAKVKIQGHASGTGVLTVTAPNTSTDRTITLPDATGTLLNSDGSAASLTAIPAANITGTLPAIDGSNLTGVGVAGISSSADATAITINSSEQVGIGTGSPTSPLHVLASSAGQTVAKFESNQAGSVVVEIDADTDRDSFFRFQEGGTTRWDFFAQGSSGTNELNIREDGGNNVIRMTQDGYVTMPLQPAFLVKVTSQVDNLAINNTHSIAFGTEIFDQNADFGSNTFTAPVTGRYQLNALLYMKQLDKDTAYNELFIVTSNRTYTNIISAPAFNADASYWTFALSVLADMDANDTSTIGFSIPNSGSSQIDLAADSYFSGYLVC
jgi:hypothetical protein